MRRVVAILVCLIVVASARAGVIRVGSKNFTEQEILAQIAAQLIERTTDYSVERRLGLGGTDLCHAALLAGQLDLYVEYTGTSLLNVLDEATIANPARAYLRVAEQYEERFGLVCMAPIGFNSTYAIAVRGQDAGANGWRTIGDLAPGAGELRAGFTAEFMERPDGYPGLREAYGTDFGSTQDLEPGLMYDALKSGQVDVICAFATDPRIDAYGFVVLEDTESFFPPYDAVAVVREQTLARYPGVRSALAVMAGAISDADMRALNGAVDIERRTPADVAGEWVSARLGEDVGARVGGDGSRAGFVDLVRSRRGELWDKTVEHLVLTALGVVIAVVIGLPLGILIHRRAPARAPVLAAAEVVQTIPSLAMLAFLFALIGVLGLLPAATALVLYALLPIVLNTYTGLSEVPRQAVQAAQAVGMSGGQRLRMVELPLAMPVIVAGIRAATVLTVGIATLSTYIGAGGLGDFIARGLARNDPRLTLLGALPAALMAVVLSLAIRGVQRVLTRR